MRSECPATENVVRAVTTATWDVTNQRAHYGCFRGPNASVSRLAILGLQDLFAIFRRDLTEPPNKLLIGAGEINVGMIQTIGATAEDPIRITVEIDPLPDNPAHAEIPQRLPKGISKRIVEAWTWHSGIDTEAGDG
jgi:hypothetical protein